MPTLVIMGQKRAALTTIQPPTKRDQLDVRAGSAEETVSSTSMSVATSVLQELEEEDLWDD